MKQKGELLIVSLVPGLAEKRSSWHKSHFKKIARAIKTNAFWTRNAIIIETGSVIKPTDLTRQLVGMGYIACSFPERKGEFCSIGGSILIRPAGSTSTWRIDFFNNTVESIDKLATSDAEKQKAQIKNRLVVYLQSGDFVVHRDHGIGIWRGIVQERGRDFFLIEYKGPIGARPDTLHVPISEEERITPYTGFRHPNISRLGSPLWAHTVKKTKADMREFAAHLLSIYAERSIKTRPPYFGIRELENIIASRFPFEQTESQKQVLSEIMRDLEQVTPMDRIIMGDVGFGKTELALRASARVASSGFQVALLSPTTLLADQHYRLWKSRLRDTPLNVLRLTRLESKKTATVTMKKIREGDTDIIIGTHRILSRDVIWKRLGLLIIDEEQRFGVRSKEHIKGLRKEIDVLTLSATPLPRTLSMALGKLRTLSLLSDPPEGRIAVKTYGAVLNENILKKAISNELERNGQVYVLETRIRKIPATLELVTRLISPCNIDWLHGRLSEKELVKSMEKFRNGETKILVSTTIIENGIDLSNVNTLIITDATRFGLSQLHQLRGRIGRGNRQAYAYLFWPSQALTDKASERIKVILQTQFLGAGQFIAERDLDMRGAGNILGREQSGIAYKIGFNLYAQFLNEAVEHLKEK